MLALSRLTKPFYSVHNVQASKDDRPEKKPFNIETFDTFHSVIARSSLFKRHTLADYTEWTLKPLSLPRPALEIIQEQMGEDSALLQTFAHRLSSSSENEFKNHFSEKTRPKLNLYKPSVFSNQIDSLRNSSMSEDVEKKMVLDVLLRKFPADFALFMSPMSEHLKSVVSDSDVNRRSVFSFFTKAFRDSYLSEARSVEFLWYPKEKILIFLSYSSDPIIDFHYITEDFPDKGRGFLIAKKPPMSLRLYRESKTKQEVAGLCLVDLILDLHIGM